MRVLDFCLKSKEIADGSSELAVWAAALDVLSSAVLSSKTCSSSCGTSAQDGTGGKGAPCISERFLGPSRKAGQRSLWEQGWYLYL